MVGWHHQFNGHEFEQNLEDSEGQEAWRAADMPSPRGHDEATEPRRQLVVRILGFHCPGSVPVQETGCHKPSGQKKRKLFCKHRNEVADTSKANI